MFPYISDELIQGAYGEVSRAKGIFEIVDGRSFYFSFGVSSVGRIEGKASYIFYHQGSNKLGSKTVHYGVKKGFA